MSLSKSIDKPILLVQAREVDRIEIQEQNCFSERCDVSPENFRTANVLRDELSDLNESDYSAIMIGGAGKYSAADDYRWMPDLLNLVVRSCEADIPMFGSCWGHQVIARALGGRVENDSTRAELGCIEVELTSAGKADLLFSPFPSSFLANMGHHDRVVELPDSATELARNDSQPYQAFRVSGLAVYGTQFHSELDAERERLRLIEYRDYYREDLPSDELFEATLQSLAETTEVDGLLARFVELYVAR